MGWFDFLWRKPQPKPIAQAPSPSPTAAPAKLPTMLILRGIAGHFGGRDWPRGALDEPPALEYARQRGYVGEVLDIDGATGPQSRQVRTCVEKIRKRDDVEALYGFSGGGCNIRHILAALGADERSRIKLIVVLGAPNNPPELYRDGPWELVYRRDPPAGHMAGPKVLLAELEAEKVADGGNALAGKPLRYLIGTDDPGAGRDDEIIEVGYDVTAPPKRGVGIAYCNLFDERNTGRYAPYLHSSDTASKYREGQIDPRGPGWERNLREQFERRRRQGFRYVELDNPDAYRWFDVSDAYDLAASHGFQVIAKNPVICENGLAMMQHPAVVGAIVERGCGTPDEMVSLRDHARKPDLPVWFVYWGKGHDDAVECARRATLCRNMGVTYSAGPKEYSGSRDLLRPRI
jgi:hypothetical protein